MWAGSAKPTQWENTVVANTIESDEIVGHVPEFLVTQVLAPVMRSGEIVSIDTLWRASEEMPPRVQEWLEGELKYPVFTKSMVA